MNYLSVENLSKTWHDKPVFLNVNFGIQKGQKVALVAGNGQGKSTLMSIIIGQESPDTGLSVFRKELKIGYLAQEPELDDQQSVIDNIILEDSEISRAVFRYERIMQLSTEDSEYDSQMAQLDSVIEEMNRLDAWDFEAKVKQVLTQLKIENHNQLASSLSGGQRKRVALAKVLLSQPDFIILDEPTNHLDLQMIEWLESYLSQRDLTLFLVTHDRYFLDRVCDSIIELEEAKLFHYKGNYQYFIESKAARELATLSELNKDKNTYRRELEWVRKMPKARGTKSKSRVESFNHLEDKIRSHRNSLEVKMNMRMDRLGTKILEFHSVNKNYGDKVILDNFSYIFKRKEKVGIIGINGVGKSTMMNLIVGLEDIDSGKIVTGETIKFGYYSQKGIKVDDSKKVIDVVREIADWIPLDDGAKLTASQLLLKFGFSYEKQFDFVTKLSGGEKRRLYLMTVLMAAPNFLILDEPTNDLDIQTLTVLEDFLDSYDGCVIVVSHDRFFMDKVVDHCFIFEGNGIIRDFPGNYTEYREMVTLEESLNEASKKEPIVKVNIEHSNQVDQQESKQKMSFKDKFELDKINSELPQKLKLKNEIIQEMSGSSLNFEELSKMAKSLEELQTEIDAMEIRWLELSI